MMHAFPINGFRGGPFEPFWTFMNDTYQSKQSHGSTLLLKCRNRGSCARWSGRHNYQSENPRAGSPAICEKCYQFEEKIAYYGQLASKSIDHEVAVVLLDLIKKLQNEKASLHPAET